MPLPPLTHHAGTVLCIVLIALPAILLAQSPPTTPTSAAITTAMAEELTISQDNLSAGVQELVELQTDIPVIQKLEEVEASMVQATLKLLDQDTGAQTIAIQTDIIEKAYEAAQEKNQSQQGGGASETQKAMMDMLKKMLGKQEQPSSEQSGSAGPAAGQGAPDADSAEAGETSTTPDSTFHTGRPRQVPSASPFPGQLLPAEFTDLLDGYNP